MRGARLAVAVLAHDGISPFHLSIPTLVFGAAGLGMQPPYDVQVCAERPGLLTTAAGYSITVDTALDAFADADLVVVPAWLPDLRPSIQLLDAVRSAHQRGARIVGLCVGATVVAASGVADGREVVTHWSAATALAREYPAVIVRSDLLWSDLGDVVTSAGSAAALDCCLHVVRTDHGSALAADLARAIVLAPHRIGSQAQYIPTPVAAAPDNDAIGRAMVWARARLVEPLDLDRWAAAAHMSRRTFTRRFRERTSSSPQQWLLQQRIDHARMLLETGSAPINVVAARSGFGSAVSLRSHFTRLLGISPTGHRALFRDMRAASVN